MNWGKRIVIAYVFFIGLIIALVVISMKQDVNLVASDYYVQEIAYQDQIERMENHRDSKNMDVHFDRSAGTITLTHNEDSKVLGEVLFFRPSDASKDRKIELNFSNNNEQVFSTSDMQAGLWKVKVAWRKGAKEYYYEQVIVI